MYSFIHQEIDVDEVMVGVVEEVVRLSVVERSLESLKKYFEQRANDALSHTMSIQGNQKEDSSHYLETTIDYFFRLV
jgi:hypothetical protein